MSTGLEKMAVAVGVALGAMALGKMVLPQCRPWTKPLSAQPRRAKGSKKRTGTVGTTGTTGIVGIVGTAVGDQHGLSLAARLCSRAFFQAG